MEETFGQMVRRRRKVLDITQAQLAERVGCTIDMVRKIEAGKRRPSRHTAERLANLLGVAAGEREQFLRRARQLPNDAAPEHAEPSPGRSLPAGMPPLIGREHDLARLRAKVAGGARLLTITGPGGVGKTHCAIQLAHDVAAAFADGVTFVPLAALQDEALVVATLAQAIGLRERAGAPVAERLAREIGDQQRLLVLDNFEHVLPAANDLAMLLEQCPRLTLLVTSRMPLRLRAEHEYLLAPLAFPSGRFQPDMADSAVEYPAIALFLARAEARHASFQLSKANMLAVVALCQRLDGLPLALELAAARMKLLTPQQLLDQINQAGANQETLLATDVRDRPARHQSLAATIAWSYNLVDPAARQLFEELACFAGGATLEAITAVAGGLQPLEALERLLDASLLQRHDPPEGPPRFDMLETIQAYARDMSESHGTWQPAQARHAAYFLARAEQAQPLLRGPAQQGALRELEDDIHNFRAALRYAHDRGDALLALQLSAALGSFWQIRGYFTEGREWLEAALALHGGRRADTIVELLAQARAHVALAKLLRRLSEHAAARAHAEAGLRLWQQLEDAAGLAQVSDTLGVLAMEKGDYNAAQSFLEESLRLYRTLGDEAGIGLALNDLGELARYQGDLALAAQRYAESLPLRHSAGDVRGEAITLNNLGVLAGMRGDLALAQQYFESSLAIDQALNDPYGVASATLNLAQVAWHGQQFDQARDYAWDGVQIARQIGEQSLLESALNCLAGIAADAGDPTQAALFWGAATRIYERLGLNRAAAEQRFHTQVVEAARARADQAAFAAAWEQGLHMPLDLLFKKFAGS